MVKVAVVIKGHDSELEVIQDMRVNGAKQRELCF